MSYKKLQFYQYTPEEKTINSCPHPKKATSRLYQGADLVVGLVGEVQFSQKRYFFTSFAALNLMQS